LLWVLIALLALACSAVLYAAGRPAKTAAGAEIESDAEVHTRFYREQLKGLERDVELGRLSASEEAAAKAELAREYLRQTREDARQGLSRMMTGRAILLAVPLAAVLSFGVYALIGQANLPAQPLAGREAALAEVRQTLDAAVAQVEARLEADPSDVRGWQVLAPIYLDQARYADAANAYRHVLDLAPPTADMETNLAEALILAGDVGDDEEILSLLESAVARDPDHLRSRFYLAGELTRRGDYEQAVPMWTRLLDNATGSESWYATAVEGRSLSVAGLTGSLPGQPGQGDGEGTDAMIAGMVEGLAERLYSEGGTGEEWLRLVQSRLVLGDRQAAQDDFARGLAALDGEDRAALLAFGEGEGLETE